MSTSTPDTPTITAPPPPPASPLPPSAPTSSTGSANSSTSQLPQPKRSLFGLKKKSTQNLGTSSPSSNTLASAGSSLKSGESIESLDKTFVGSTGSSTTVTEGGGTKGAEGGGGGGGGGAVKKRKGVFGRKVKNDSGGASFTGIEEDKDNEGEGGNKGGRGGSGDSFKENGKERGTSEDDGNSLLYESDEDT
ncbi:hypothetical protein L873DRAFT_193109 [Choiromyces venosus 120613-1]|uniref:Uncharacterized protein n=1 Tax=Choiromyces venosus 120613-1 TaxID=1336337 RepID=A0A3N4J2C6_9PEZI|nr:hypothetical protein L873DRAFT_193109 [Choiromyces venosus 120613-1]